MRIRPDELRIVDRIVVADQLIREREAYYDSLGLMLTLLARPSAWAGYWRHRASVLSPKSVTKFYGSFRRGPRCSSSE